jgi:hypothetical protein
LGLCNAALHELHPLCRAAPRGRLEYTAAHSVVVDEKLLDLVHERWRQVIEIAHFGVETRTNRKGNHAVIPYSLPLLVARVQSAAQCRSRMFRASLQRHSGAIFVVFHRQIAKGHDADNVVI